ncbi:type I 3-dehydroquinate dehydratase [Bacteroidota bacterium]
MKRPRICVVIINDDLEAIRQVAPLVDLFEVRIDHVGDTWPELASRLDRPWIACNRGINEGGLWEESEEGRIEELIKAAEMGASIVDIEIGATKLVPAINLIKGKARCLISHHDFQATPPIEELDEIVQRQISAGADICKVVTTANSPDDNLTMLQLLARFPQVRLVSLAMGNLGLASRILCPLAGGAFTYASIEKDKESAPGQISAGELVKIYQMVGAWGTET